MLFGMVAGYQMGEEGEVHPLIRGLPMVGTIFAVGLSFALILGAAYLAQVLFRNLRSRYGVLPFDTDMVVEPEARAIILHQNKYQILAICAGVVGALFLTYLIGNLVVLDAVSAAFSLGFMPMCAFLGVHALRHRRRYKLLSSAKEDTQS